MSLIYKDGIVGGAFGNLFILEFEQFGSCDPELILSH